MSRRNGHVPTAHAGPPEPPAFPPATVLPDGTSNDTTVRLDADRAEKQHDYLFGLGLATRASMLRATALRACATTDPEELHSQLHALRGFATEWIEALERRENTTNGKAPANG